MKIIAYYLPQYHRTPHNDEWWGEGFTEWTNVRKAKPLFKGHEQPKVPADLGYYDLTDPRVRGRQAALAREAGVDGFCYYHYWFGNGHAELETPFNQVVESGQPTMPFCLCWANESWQRKFWNKDGAVTHAKVLAEQTYPGEDDDRAHFEWLIKAFKDPRYLKIDNKPVFVIYKPLEFPEVNRFIERWNQWALAEGFDGMYFIGFTFKADTESRQILDLGFDAVNSCRLNRDKIRSWGWLVRKLKSLILNTPRRAKYAKIFPTLISEIERTDPRVIPTLIPNWDHTPRSGTKGDLLTECDPTLFEQHCVDVLGSVAKKDEPALCFIKSWNEWGEGNYMEPDTRHGHGYLQALARAKEKVKRSLKTKD